MPDLATIELRIQSTGLDEAGRGLSQLGAQAARGEAAVQQLVGTFNRLLGLFVGFQSAASTVRTMAEFSDVMGSLRGVATSASESLETQAATMTKLETAARTVGLTTRFSATEGATGLLELTRAGQTAEEAIRTLPSVLNLAQGASIGLDDSVKIVVTTLTLFRLGIEQAAHVTDVLTTGANESLTSVTRMAEALRNLGRIPASLNISLEDTVAALEALAQGGRQGFVGGTDLRTVLSALQSPTDKARAALHDLHIEVKDLNPATHSLQEIFGTLAAHQVNASNSVEIFNQKQRVGALILIEAAKAAADGRSALERFREGIDKGAGSSQRFSDIMLGTFGGALDQLKNAFDTLTSTGNRFGGTLIQAVVFVTDVVRVLAGFTGELHSNRETVQQVATAVIGIVAALSSYITIQGAASAAMAVFSALTLANPIGFLAVAIGAAVVAWIEFKDSLIVVGGVTTTVTNLMIAAFTTIIDRITALVDGSRSLGESFSGIIDEMLDRAERLNRVDFSKPIVEPQEEIAGQLLAMVEDAEHLETNVDAVTAATQRLAQARAAIRGTAPPEFGAPPLGAIPDIAGLTAQATPADFRSRALAAAAAGEEGGGQVRSKEERVVDRLFEDLRAERDAIGLTNRERQLRVDLLRIDREATKGEIPDVEALKQKYIEEFRALELAENAHKAALTLADAFTSAFQKVTSGAASLKDAFRQAFLDIARQIEQTQIKNALASLFGNIFTQQGGGGGGGGGTSGLGAIFAQLFASTASAHGNVFSAAGSGMPELVPFGGGGVVDEPTYFPMAGGRAGLLGEAGTEGIFPLARTPSGDLGVKATGGSNTTINQNITIKTQDANSFHRSRRQTLSDLRGAAGNAR